ncbi:MAG: universal stress protein [Dehalococcoidia bacterium]
MAVYKKILVTLDRSRLSETVLPELRKLLDGSPAEVTLFTVGRPARATRRRRGGPSHPTPLGTGQPGSSIDGLLEPAPPRYAETKGQAVERKEHEQLKYLESLSSPIRESGSTVKLARRLGEPAREIIDFAREGGFDLVVMATHGRSGLSELVQGSIAEAVVRSGVAPVLLVRPRKT